MLERTITGTVVCAGCDRVVDIGAARCRGCGWRQPGLWGWGPALGRLRLPFHRMVLRACILFYLATLIVAPGAFTDVFSQIARGQFFNLLAPSGEPLFLFGMSGRMPIFEAGRWWTVLSAAWLHGNLLHVVFNMLWIYQIVPAVGVRYGAGRLIVIYTISSIAGFLLTSVMALFPLPDALSGAHLTVGASAPLFGLFGALVLYGHKTADPLLSRQFVYFVVIWVLIGFVATASTDSVRIDNWAHLGGFAGGYVTAWLLDPARRENTRDVLAGLICLGASVLSILASVVHGLWLMG